MIEKINQHRIAALSSILLITSFAVYSRAEIENARTSAAQFDTGRGNHMSGVPLVWSSEGVTGLDLIRFDKSNPYDGQIQELPLPQIKLQDNASHIEDYGAESPSLHSVNSKTSSTEVRKKHDYILQKQSPNNLSELNLSQIKSLFHATSNNKVARLDMVSHYDPNGELGFCFGRAMASHLLARRMGLKEESTGKMFIIGDLKSGETTEWRFHVTAIVKGPNNNWYTIDPITPGPMPIREWIKRIRSIWDKQKKAKVYLMHSDAVMPDVRIFPAPNEEKGELIIEISFDPLNKPGFNPFPANFEPLVFNVDEKAADRYFLNVHEKNETDSFDFLGITINSDRYDYRNYFADLTDDITSQKQDVKLPALRTSSLLNDVPAYETKGLFSPKWGIKKSSK